MVVYKTQMSQADKTRSAPLAKHTLNMPQRRLLEYTSKQSTSRLNEEKPVANLCLETAVETDNERVVCKSKNVSFSIDLLHLVTEHQVVLEQLLHCKDLTRCLVSD